MFEMGPLTKLLSFVFIGALIREEKVSCREQKFIIQHYGGLCVSARNDNRLYLTASCSPFSLTDKKALRHVPTGRCVGPENHNNGARITLQGDCNNANTRFEQTSSPHYSVKHLLSGKCLHPLGGSSHPRDGTLIVLYSGCNEPRLKFKFHVLSQRSRVVFIKSWKGDYLHRANTARGVTAWGSRGSRSKWVLEKVGDKITLRSYKGDYLHRYGGSRRGVTTWPTGSGNYWKMEKFGVKYMFRSYKGDYLHRPDSNNDPRVSTWPGHVTGNMWTIEDANVPPPGQKILLKAFRRGDFLHRTNSWKGVTTWTASGSVWTIETLGNNKVKLRSYKADYLHRRNGGGVVGWKTGQANIWTMEKVGNMFKFRSYAGDCLHRKGQDQGVTTWDCLANGNFWIIQYLSEPSPPPKAKDWIPVLYFDKAARSYCFPDEAKDDNNGKCKRFNSNAPIYYQQQNCNSDTIKIAYWFWYGKQKGCITAQVGGKHDNDWEHVILSFRKQYGIWNLNKVTFHQHSGHYSRRVGSFLLEGNRVIVYVGKIAHGSYHIWCHGKSLNLFSPKYCQGGCGYWDDFRNNDGSLRLRTKNLRPLDSVTSSKIRGSAGGHYCKEADCDGASWRALGESGCWQNKV